MTTQILVVEDDEEFIAALVEIGSSLNPVPSITVAKSRDRAIELLKLEHFDFAILDLNIPTIENGLDKDPEHGKYVFHNARVSTPGLKILVLTQSPSDEFIDDLLEHKHDADVWSEGAPVGTVEFLRKLRFDEVPERIEAVVKGVAGLNEVELSLDGVNLTLAEDRLVRIVAKRQKAARCSVSRLGGGKSGSSTFKLSMHDQAGIPMRSVFAKLGDRSRVFDENARFEEHIVNLDGNATPRKIALIEFGGCRTCGIFYQLADGFPDAIFSVLGKDDDRAAAAVRSVRELLRPWSGGEVQQRRSIRDLRRDWLNDATATDLHAKFGLSWAEAFEAREIQTRHRCVHGDLHGENILVADNCDTQVIDYGDVQQSASSYDAISLELSAVLQPNAPLRVWPDKASCERWNDVEHYVDGAHIAAFIRECRAWANDVAAGKREMAACAYVYLLRQLKYDDIDHGRVLSLMTGARAMMDAT